MTKKEEEICYRIRELRKETGFNQKDFGQKIEVAQGYLTNIETAKRPVTDKILRLICLQSWNGRMVNEEWLRTGEGEMFCTVLEEDELATYCADICSGKDPFIANTILEYMRLGDNDRKAIRDFIKSIAKDL